MSPCISIITIATGGTRGEVLRKKPVLLCRGVPKLSAMWADLFPSYMNSLLYF